MTYSPWIGQYWTKLCRSRQHHLDCLEQESSDLMTVHQLDRAGLKTEQLADYLSVPKAEWVGVLGYVG